MLRPKAKELRVPRTDPKRLVDHGHGQKVGAQTGHQHHPTLARKKGRHGVEGSDSCRLEDYTRLDKIYVLYIYMETYIYGNTYIYIYRYIYIWKNIHILYIYIHSLWF
jgi:capsular polysaccharide biosynthesis protein